MKTRSLNIETVAFEVLLFGFISQLILLALMF